MTSSHLAYESVWVECSCQDECVYGTRVDETPEYLNSFPFEWTHNVYLDEVSEIVNEGRRTINPYRCWRKTNGNYHRIAGPARIFADGSTEWYIDGKLHREGGPAIDYSNGTKKWYKNGDLHREDGPAVVYLDGHTEWWWFGNEVEEITWTE